MQTYGVWAHGPGDFTEDLKGCLERLWPNARVGFDLAPGAVLDVDERFRAVEDVPLLRAVFVDHAPNVLVDWDWDRLQRMEAGPVARGAEPFVVDPAVADLSRLLGGALVLCWRENPAMAYAAVFRQGRCDSSCYLAPQERLARFDGHGGVVEEKPGRDLPELDRMGVLLGGLRKFAGGHWRLDEDERLQLPEILGW
jgi:hypothetical protein